MTFVFQLPYLKHTGLLYEQWLLSKHFMPRIWRDVTASYKEVNLGFVYFSSHVTHVLRLARECPRVNPHYTARSRYSERLALPTVSTGYIDIKSK